MFFLKKNPFSNSFFRIPLDNETPLQECPRRGKPHRNSHEEVVWNYKRGKDGVIIFRPKRTKTGGGSWFFPSLQYKVQREKEKKGTPCEISRSRRRCFLKKEFLVIFRLLFGGTGVKFSPKKEFLTCVFASSEVKYSSRPSGLKHWNHTVQRLRKVV